MIQIENSQNTKLQSNASSSGLIVESLRCVRRSEQVIMVITNNLKDTRANLETFERINGTWKRSFGPIPAQIGTKGFVYNKTEGDSKSPAGAYTIGFAFGKHENPGTLLPYRQTTENDFWVDDIDSPYYNTWQVGPSKGRWKSAEALRPEAGYYDYAVVINYNTADRIPGKGSAIFLHVWEGEDIPTAGCISIEYNSLVKIICWLDPSKNPVIVQGPLSKLLSW